MSDLDPALNTPCPHGNSPVTCVPCLNDAVDETAVLAELERTYGMCLACRSVEVELNSTIGVRDFSDIGESSESPVGYGCELC